MGEPDRGTVGIYVHVPFCVKKCRYCDFVSGPSDCLEREKYVEALLCETKRRGDKSMPCGTVFIGGGTPSILSPSQIMKLADALRESFDLTNVTEFTVEANPESLSPEKAEAMKLAGASRISIGFQSLEPRALKVLGRVHTAEQAVRAFETARNAGFENINVDLMLGLPGEPEGEFESSLKKVIGLSPEHISAYSLIVEEGTPLAEDIASGRIPEPDDERDRDDYHLARDILHKAGYIQYEISNFAKPGMESRHNRRYWEQKHYVGLGAAAASFTGLRRFTNTKDVALYTEKLGDVKPDEDDTLGIGEAMSEFMMLGFRLTDGPDFAEFKRRYGEDPGALFAEKLGKLEARGLIGRSGSAERPYRLTEKGLDFANEIFTEFV